jgi:hypothetical protein
METKPSSRARFVGRSGITISDQRVYAGVADPLQIKNRAECLWLTEIGLLGGQPALDWILNV